MVNWINENWFSLAVLGWTIVWSIFTYLTNKTMQKTRNILDFREYYHNLHIRPTLNKHPNYFGYDFERGKYRDKIKKQESYDLTLDILKRFCRLHVFMKYSKNNFVYQYTEDYRLAYVMTEIIEDLLSKDMLSEISIDHDEFNSLKKKFQKFIAKRKVKIMLLGDEKNIEQIKKQYTEKCVLGH
jgi:hypothetical protein